MIEVNYNEYKETLAQNMKLVIENHNLKEEVERLNNIINNATKTLGDWTIYETSACTDRIIGETLDTLKGVDKNEKTS